MNSLFLIYDIITNGFMFEILDIFFFICIFFGIYTIISKNPIVSVLFLIGLFVAIACYLIFIGIDFIGISYLLVYVGAVSILFLFILMLINIRVSELLSENNNYLPLSLLSVLPFFFIIGKIFPSTNFKFQEFTKLYKNDEYFFQSKQDIFFVSGNIWDNNLINNTQISSIGNILYTNYSIWLIITSIILLLAMVGAIIITLKK